MTKEEKEKKEEKPFDYVAMREQELKDKKSGKK